MQLKLKEMMDGHQQNYLNIIQIVKEMEKNAEISFKKYIIDYYEDSVIFNNIDTDYYVKYRDLLKDYIDSLKAYVSKGSFAILK